MRVSRRKGPAPVDLSAISDAAHGFTSYTPVAEPQELPRMFPTSTPGASISARLVVIIRMTDNQCNGVTTVPFAWCAFTRNGDDRNTYQP